MRGCCVLLRAIHIASKVALGKGVTMRGYCFFGEVLVLHGIGFGFNVAGEGKPLRAGALGKEEGKIRDCLHQECIYIFYLSALGIGREIGMEM